ncbi:MAG TPA: hypothetical protein VMB71_05060 [Acetobacteraceae bacterium]|nr:hypothetical protein [Acetobacteraceae bacterium]
MEKAEKDRAQLRIEIRIAMFWRELIGDAAYIKFDPDDMLRWYLAFEETGARDVRAHLAARYTAHADRTPILGLVGEAPHPPAWLVREWLETQHEVVVSKWVAGASALGFMVFCSVFFTTLHGCQNLQTINPLAYKPPSNQPQIQSTAVGAMPGGPNVLSSSGSLGAPSSAVSGAAVPSVSATGPSSQGISGGAPAPATAPSSTGISGGQPHQ